MVNSDDPRDTITTESFGVAPELLGLPLARPWRRAAAILADLVPVAIMANAGFFVFLAFVAFFVVWRALSGLGASSLLRKGAATPVRFGASIFAFVMVLRVGGVFDSIGNRGNDEGDDESSIENVGDVQIDVDELLASLGVTETTGEPSQALQGLVRENDRLRERNQDLRDQLDRRENGGGFMRWVANALDDLGIGFGWGALYFTVFTVLGNGQTPGKRLMGIRVIRLDARPVGWWLAFERFGSYFASFSTGMMGFAQIFWDRNRQALHDKAVETVVIRMHHDDAAVYERLNAARK